jgi:hypothetical protein
MMFAVINMTIFTYAFLPPKSFLLSQNDQYAKSEKLIAEIQMGH